MRYLLLGSTGMLGKAFSKIAKRNGHEIIGLAHSGADINIDITDDKSLIYSIISTKPDAIINTIAITNLGYCENNPSQAYLINSRPSSILANYCSDNSIKLVHISTDHYFTGDNKLIHDEQSPVLLLNEYARTKFVAEKFVETNSNSLTIRTNIVGFRGLPEKPTFVEWVLNTLKEEEIISAFHDYYTSSIDVLSFSEILLHLIEKESKGLFNVASCDVSSKMDFILKMAETFGYDLSKVKSGSIKDIDGPDRAESLGLDVSKVEAVLGYTMPNLDTVISNLFNEYISDNCEI